MSLLNYPQTKFPPSPWTQAFRCFEKVLRNDPRLSALVETWVTYRGESIEIELSDRLPTAGQCPCLLMGPFPVASEWRTEGEHFMPVSVRLRLCTAGTNADEIMNFAGAVQAALFPQDNHGRYVEIQDEFHAVGVTHPTIRLAAFGIATDDIPVMVADGTIEFGMLIAT